MIPDNYDLWEAHDRNQQEQIRKLPVCECCMEPIQDDYLYEVNDSLLCEECMIRNFRKEVDDYIE